MKKSRLVRLLLRVFQFKRIADVSCLQSSELENGAGLAVPGSGIQSEKKVCLT